MPIGILREAPMLNYLYRWDGVYALASRLDAFTGDRHGPIRACDMESCHAQSNGRAHMHNFLCEILRHYYRLNIAHREPDPLSVYFASQRRGGTPSLSLQIDVTRGTWKARERTIDRKDHTSLLSGSRGRIRRRSDEQSRIVGAAEAR